MLDEAMSEQELQEAVLEGARLGGWICYHTFDSRRSPPGFPDLVMVHPRRREMAMWELKSARGKLSTAQYAWGAALGQVNAPPDYRVVRPADLTEALRFLTARVTPTC